MRCQNSLSARVFVVDCIAKTFFLLQAPWPVNIVIDSSCQKLYNLVFLFLLKLKQAKWSLDELRFSGFLHNFPIILLNNQFACVDVKFYFGKLYSLTLITWPPSGKGIVAAKKGLAT